MPGLALHALSSAPSAAMKRKRVRRRCRARVPAPPCADERSQHLLKQLWGRVPPVVFEFCRLVIAKLGLLPPLDALELFAGKKAVTLALRGHGYKAVAFEKLDSACVGFMTDVGDLHAAMLALSLRQNGLLVAAPVCSSWVWLSRSSTHRSACQPLGRGDAAEVGNEMVSRLVVLLWVVSCFGVRWVVEQPRGSLLQLHPRFQDLLSTRRVHRSSWRMSDFGAQHATPTWLYSNLSLNQLWFFRRRMVVQRREALATVRTNAAGKLRVAGKREELKASPAYPAGFGEAIAQFFRLSFNKQLCPLTPSTAWPDDSWDDAGLPACMHALRG